MGILSIIVDNYFKIMESINVRSISVVIIVLIILIELLEMLIKPEEIGASIHKISKKKKSEKSNFLRRIVNINKEEKTAPNKIKITPFNKDVEGNYFISDVNKIKEETSIIISDEKEVLGSKIININTVLDGNNLYLERIEKTGDE